MNETQLQLLRSVSRPGVVSEGVVPARGGRECEQRGHPPQARLAPLPPVSCCASPLASLGFVLAGSTVHVGGLSACPPLFLFSS